MVELVSGVGDTDERVPVDGELRVRFCIIFLPCGVNGLDDVWLGLASPPSSSSSVGMDLRLPLGVVVVEEDLPSHLVGVDGNAINGGNVGAINSDDTTGGDRNGE